MERRKELGFCFLQVLRKQSEIFIKDEDEREKHQVTFMATVREISRMLKEFTDENNNDLENEDKVGDNDDVPKK